MFYKGVPFSSVLSKLFQSATKRARVVIVLFFVSFSALSQFTPGNFVLLQVGNGTGPLVNTGNQILLREFSPAGVSAFSVAISTSLNPLVIGGTAVSEGGLSLSPNGKYLVFAGYATSLTFTSSLSGATASMLNRGIGVVGAAGNYSRVATSPTFYSGNSIRSATSDGNDNYWAAGGNAGANYFGLNTAAATIQTSITNTRHVMAFNGNLYFSTGSGTAGIYRVGSGFPVNSGQTCSLVMNTSGTGTTTASPYAFFFNSALTVCYVADDRTPANNGGIQKWIYTANTWSLAYTLGTGAPYGARAVIADFSGTNPRLYATTSEGTLNRLIVINDLGPGSTATTLATASANTIFRGLAFSPFCYAPQAATISTNGTVCANQAFTLSSNFSGTPPFTYTWSGPGSYSSYVQSPVLSTTLSGNYSVMVGNGCGTDAQSASVTVNALPVLSVNSCTICAGGIAMIASSGAATYTWSNAMGNASVSVNPVMSTVYTVTGTSTEGCSSVSESTVQVQDSLFVQVNSAAFCLGRDTVLTASGAMGYTWSTGSSANSIYVNPVFTSTYAVTGFAPGCAAATAIGTVTVNQPPTVSIQIPVYSFCLDDPPVNLSVNPPGGILSGMGLSGTAFNPGLSSAGNFTLSYLYVDSLGCSASDSLRVAVNLCTLVKKIKNPQIPIISPNPVNDYLYLKLADLQDEPSIEIFELYAQKRHEIKIQDLNEAIDVHHYPAGIYLIWVKSGAKQTIIKFIKE